jgi:beta-phosphoglucomutase-like phosphatase (HAD superfamily)
VLVDSEPTSNAVLAQALTGVGLPTSAESALNEFRGLHMRDVVARTEERLGHPLPEGWIESYEQARADAFRRSLAATPGAAEAVRAVSAAGPAVCVASQGRREKTALTPGLPGRGSCSEPTPFSRPIRWPAESPTPTSSCTPRPRWAPTPSGAR